MIVVAGEALIDLAPAQTAAGQPALQPRPAGSPLNVAVGLARLGTDVSFLGRISTDRFGDDLIAHLEAEKVGLRHVTRGPEPTALAFIHLDEQGDASYDFRWEGTADRMLGSGDVGRLPDDVDAIHVGSVSLMLEPGATTIERLISRHAGEQVISLDPNVRSPVTDRREHRHRLEDLMSSTDLVKVSTRDLDWLYPPAKPADVAHWWLALGAALVIITDGHHGATAYSREREVVGPPVTVETVVDTVGAGDAFTAATLSWLDRREMLSREALSSLGQTSLADLLAFANRAAALTCTRVGADPPRRTEL